MTVSRYSRSGWLIALFAGLGMMLGAQTADVAAKIYADSSKSVFLLIVKSETGEAIAQGTGFLVTGGKLITNRHVVTGGSVFIDLGAAKIPTTIERVDAANDLALLKPGVTLEAKPLVVVQDLPTPGTNVYAIGNPAGLERSISTGVVSGIRQMNGRQLIQVTSPISPGSSGGPILNARGEVIGVAVGILESGQNLNFAVPASLVQLLVRGGVSISTDFSSLMDRFDSLVERRDQYKFSAEPESDYQKLNAQANAALNAALDRAGNAPNELLRVALKAESQDSDIAISAAERALRAKATAEANVVLGEALKWKAAFAEDAEKPALLARAEKSFRAALKLSKQPTYEILYDLADVLEDRENYTESDAFFRQALDSALGTSNVVGQASSLRALIRTAYDLGQPAQGNKWFDALVNAGAANSYDWQSQGKRLDRTRNFREAGQSYLQAAKLGGPWTNWCEAAGSFYGVSGEEDNVLSSARECVSKGVGQKDSESRLANAHFEIADVLNTRGVYAEALSHASESTALVPSSTWAFNAEAEALIGLRRFQEAINASNQAIRLSDGKYGVMHFNLGTAYFNVENWEFARQSFERAAQLDTKDDAAAYNVAICFVKLRYFSDAANWYEEVLRRNPSRRDKQELLNRIQTLRR